MNKSQFNTNIEDIFEEFEMTNKFIKKYKKTKKKSRNKKEVSRKATNKKAVIKGNVEDKSQYKKKYYNKYLQNKCDYVSKKRLLTQAESMFYNILSSYIEDINKKNQLIIFSKVRLADIVSVNSKVRDNNKKFYKIGYKHIDFVICNRNTFEVLMAIELDDYTHKTRDAIKRDEFKDKVLKEAHVKIIRVSKEVDSMSTDDIKDILQILRGEKG